MNITKLLLTLLITTSLFAITKSEQKLSPDQLQASNREKISFIDTFSIKSAYSYAITSTTKDNGGITGIENSNNKGAALAFRLVFNNGYIPYFKPYVDFSTYIHDDRNFYIPSVGLRHDFELESRWIEPYASFGVGYSFLNRHESPVAGASVFLENGKSSNLTLEGGVDFYITKSLALDLSLRYDSYDISTTIGGNYQLTTLADTGALSILAGLVYRFGDDHAYLDDDADGIPNRKDYCPRTPLDSPIDAFGCALDDDRDSVINIFDICPNTPLGAPVDAQGCALDTDVDGVIDLDDKCPDTLKNVPVTSCGCAPYKFDFILNYKFASYRIEDLVNNPIFRVVPFMQKHEEYKIRIVGFADSTGSDEFNEKLSKLRAIEARKFLLEKGIDKSRIKILWRGKNEPSFKNDTSKNRGLNRRIFVQIYREDVSLVKAKEEKKERVQSK